MNITLRCFAELRERVGSDRRMIALFPDATVSDLLERVRLEYPALAPLLAKSLVAVNLEYAGKGARLKDGDEVALLPPVSGG